MTEEVNDLIIRLRRQAKLYDEIDAGTHYGWNKDADNIREAIYILRSFESTWTRLKDYIRVRCENPELFKSFSKAGMALNIEANILGDMRMFENELFGREDNEQPTETENQGDTHTG